MNYTPGYQYKIAVVKSSIYQDLWVANITSSPLDIFQTSLMRCSPIGLSEFAKTDFIIVKDSHEFPCKEYPYVSSLTTQKCLQYEKSKKNPDLPFLDDTYHRNTTINEVSHNVDDIAWEDYNIIIVINACIPDRIIEKYPEILWSYYVSENEPEWLTKKIGKYDILLNQEVQKKQNDFSIGFPYTFLGKNTLESLHNTLFSSNNRHGIFMEINNTTERPIITIPDSFKYISQITNIPIYLHQQNIMENLKAINKSSYFVKIHGRQIRGNGVLESISSGTLVLINKNLIMFDNLIPNECHVESVEDVINKINYFEKNKNEYVIMLTLQKQLLDAYYSKIPFQNLCKKYNEKLSKLRKQTNV